MYCEHSLCMAAMSAASSINHAIVYTYKVRDAFLNANRILDAFLNTFCFISTRIVLFLYTFLLKRNSYTLCFTFEALLKFMNL